MTYIYVLYFMRIIISCLWEKKLTKHISSNGYFFLQPCAVSYDPLNANYAQFPVRERNNQFIIRCTGSAACLLRTGRIGHIIHIKVFTHTHTHTRYTYITCTAIKFVVGMDGALVLVYVTSHRRAAPLMEFQYARHTHIFTFRKQK